MDTIRILIESYEDSSINFIRNLSGKLYDQEISQRNQLIIIKGRLKNLRIFATEKTLRIQGSLAKYYFGNNIEKLNTTQIHSIIEELSSFFGTDISEGKVTKLHYGINIKLPFASNLIFKRLGHMPYMNRFEQKDALYYQNNSRKLVIYDKTKESKRKSINGQNITRIELRYEKNMNYHFKRRLKVLDLCKQEMSIFLESEIKRLYNLINKVQQLIVLQPTCKTSVFVDQLATFGVQMIGYQKIYAQIIEWNDRGLTPQNKHYRNLEKLKELQSNKFSDSEDSVMYLLDKRINFNANSIQL